MEIKLNQEQVNILAHLVKEEAQKLEQQKETGKRMFRKYSKILFALTGKNL